MISEVTNELKSYKCISLKGTQVRLHRVIMERHLKRKLKSNEIVHHINGDIWDNRPSNLEIHTRASHARLHCEHIAIRPFNGKVLICCSCGKEKYHSPSAVKRLDKPNYKCRNCYINGNK